MMKKTFLYFIKFSFGIFLLLQASSAGAQGFITWNTATTATTLSGTYSGGTVTVSLGGTGSDVLFTSPSSVITNLNGATAVQGFKTNGPASTPPSKSVIFTFSSPVIVSELNIEGINKTTNYDKFEFSGVTFTSVTGNNCTYTLTGATPYLSYEGNARWSTSTTPVTSFTVNYFTNGGVTHAILYYSMKVTKACAAGSIAPQPSVTTITNDCATSTTVNLNSLVATTPTNAVLKWYSDNTHTTEVSTPTAVTTSGTYYAFYYDATNYCYSPVSAAVTATVTPCCPTTSPTVN